METSDKYGRSLHAQISLGTTSDDRFMPNGYIREFARMNELVLTEKLDGQNNAFKKSGVFARSHAAPSILPWDKPMRERWELIKNDLGDLEIFGENMYGVHSIGYKSLESFYYVFAVREKDYWMSWEEVKFYASMFDFPTVPELEIKKPLNQFSDSLNNGMDENNILREWLTSNLGMSWENFVETPGMLGGYDPQDGSDACEGFVVRNASGYYKNDGKIPVAENEFNNLFKLVRKKHVKTDVHWTKNWKPANLIDYNKYGWYSYEYLNH